MCKKNHNFHAPQKVLQCNTEVILPDMHQRSCETKTGTFHTLKKCFCFLNLMYSANHVFQSMLNLWPHDVCLPLCLAKLLNLGHMIVLLPPRNESFQMPWSLPFHMTYPCASFYCILSKSQESHGALSPESLYSLVLVLTTNYLKKWFYCCLFVYCILFLFLFCFVFINPNPSS